MAINVDDTLFSSSFSYQKVAVKGNTTDSVASNSAPPGSPPTGTTVTIPHNLGYISSARVWFDPALGKRFPATREQYSDDTTFLSEANDIWVRKSYLTVNDLIVEYVNLSGADKNVTTYYRVYYDN